MSLEDQVRDAHRRHRNRRSTPRSNTQMNRLQKDAWAAVQNAIDTRARLRGSTIPGEAERESAIEEAIDRLNGVAGPVRSEQGRLARDPERDQRWGTVLRSVSLAIQTERRKLWKMQRKGRR